MGMILNLVGAAIIATITPAAANADDGVLRSADHNGAVELARGDYAKAGRELAAAQQVSPDANDILLNLAQLNLRSGRIEAARDLYRRVLAGPDDQMLLARGQWQSAHGLARAGLQTASTTQVVAR